MNGPVGSSVYIIPVDKAFSDVGCEEVLIKVVCVDGCEEVLIKVVRVDGCE